jgi:thioredoxin 1
LRAGRASVPGIILFRNSFPLGPAASALFCTQEFTSENFQHEVLESAVPVLVDFSSPLCPPCRRLTPHLDQLAAEADGQYRIGKVNAYEQTDLATEYRISALPTLLFFKRGEVVHSLVGYHDKNTLSKALRQIA